MREDPPLLGERVGLFDSARERENKARAVVERSAFI